MKAAEKPKEVGVDEEGLCVIIVGTSVGEGAGAVIVKGSRAASKGAGVEFFIDGADN